MIKSLRSTVANLVLLTGVFGCLTAHGAMRVALLDFTADDNSWPAAEAASDFAAVLQVELAGVAGVEWVERAQLKLAEREL